MLLVVDAPRPLPGPADLPGALSKNRERSTSPPVAPSQTEFSMRQGRAQRQ